MATIHCSAQITPQHVLQKLSQVLRSTHLSLVRFFQRRICTFISDVDIGCMTSLKDISTYKMLETSVMEILKTLMKGNKLHIELYTTENIDRKRQINYTVWLAILSFDTENWNIKIEIIHTKIRSYILSLIYYLLHLWYVLPNVWCNKIRNVV